MFIWYNLIGDFMNYEKHLISTKTIEIKKSKFIGYSFHVTNKVEIDEILTELRKEHRKARHLPYAYKFDNNIKKSDDKEPANTAGGPILNIIEKNNLNNILIVVIRYFGGIKLGAGGLIRAYGSAAKEVIQKEG